MDDVGRDDVAVAIETDTIVLDLGLVGGVDRRRSDLRHAADTEDAVATLDDGGRCIRGHGKDSLQERLIGARVIGLEPAEVAGLRRA